ncbi:MAG: hypothetical protein PHC75_03830 [Burkholderiales bacterium]|nr:hypothetical protein [Burkholderiales bacterium]
MKILKILLISVGALSLFACNNGDSVGSDIQQQTTSGGTVPNTYQLAYRATGCQTIASNGGTCTVVLNYGGNGNYGNLLPTFASGMTGYTNNMSSACTQPSGSSTYNNNPCTITITSNSGTNTGNKQNPVINLGGTNANVSFNLGGGL